MGVGSEHARHQQRNENGNGARGEVHLYSVNSYQGAVISEQLAVNKATVRPNKTDWKVKNSEQWP
ncbi:hypothetical protein GCM10022407_27930 [Hymenobacter antarcticus]|uniref:Uncharacterized protein n=1 Tax=Hymenobacter antarcticus TaxID=486270 RepID=A0ABP7QEA5_9BACT